jgi:hypothetical protein
MSSSRPCTTARTDRRNAPVGSRGCVRLVSKDDSSILGFADRSERRSALAPLQLKVVAHG